MKNFLSRFFLRSKVPENIERLEELESRVTELETTSERLDNKMSSIEARVGVTSPEWWKRRVGA